MRGYSLIDNKDDYNAFNFFNGSWINKGKILFYLGIELYLMK